MKNIYIFCFLFIGGCQSLIPESDSVIYEEPGCDMRHQEEWMIAQFESDYGALSNSQRECVADYRYAMVPVDEWTLYAPHIGLWHPNRGNPVIFIKEGGDPETDLGWNCRKLMQFIMRHEILHHINYCTGHKARNANHSNAIWENYGDFIHVNGLVSEPEQSACLDTGVNCMAEGLNCSID